LPKLCNKCKEIKSLDLFCKDKYKNDGYSTICRPCKKLYKKEYYKLNSEKVKGSVNNYRSSNKDKINLYTKEKKKKSITYKLAHILRNRIGNSLKGNVKKGSAVRDLGCTVPELKQHLESKFKDGMTWDNYGLYGWHIDHIRPLASFDLTDQKDFLKACHYSNLQPLWAKDNLSKGSKFEVVNV
jgi:hypothetical protein